MCPLCIGAATLFVSSGTSAGALVAVLYRAGSRKSGYLELRARNCGRAEKSADKNAQAALAIDAPNSAIRISRVIL
jgi:predicted acylesterase/phospholipase RssA